MAYPVTAIVNTALEKTPEAETLLYYATPKYQLALQRWSFQANVQTTDYHENGLWSGPIVLPSSLASAVQRGMVKYGSFCKNHSCGD